MLISGNIGALLAAALLAALALQCSVHIDADPFHHADAALLAAYVATAHGCADAANPELDAARREAGAVFCALGIRAIDEHDDDDRH